MCKAKVFEIPRPKCEECYRIKPCDGYVHYDATIVAGVCDRCEYYKLNKLYPDDCEVV